MNHAAWLWPALAVTIGIGAATLFVWAFTWDRPRGRRRCPKCWYPMDGVPADGNGCTCPECGRRITSEKSLLRTRRRWRFVLLATLAGAGAYEAWSAPRIAREGWTGAVPTAALILAAPWPQADVLPELPAWREHLRAALRTRHTDGYVPRWQYGLWRWRVQAGALLRGRLGIDAASRRALEKLDGTALSATAREESIREFLERLSRETGVPVVTDWPALERGAVRDSAAWRSCGDRPALASLESLFDRWDRGSPTLDACWDIAAGVIHVRSPAPPGRTVLAVYGIDDLVPAQWEVSPSHCGLMPSPPPAWVRRPESVVEAILSIVRPEDWIENGGDQAGVELIGGSIFVTAPAQHQFMIERLLEAIRAAGPVHRAAYWPDIEPARRAALAMDRAVVVPADVGSLPALIAHLQQQTGVLFSDRWGLHPGLSAQIHGAGVRRHAPARAVLEEAIQEQPGYRGVMRWSPDGGVIQVVHGGARVPRTLGVFAVEDINRGDLATSTIDQAVAPSGPAPPARSRSDELYELAAVITQIVEPAGWLDNGGDEASLHIFGERLIIRAPTRTLLAVEALLGQLRAGPVPRPDPLRPAAR